MTYPKGTQLIRDDGVKLTADGTTNFGNSYKPVNQTTSQSNRTIQAPNYDQPSQPTNQYSLNYDNYKGVINFNPTVFEQVRQQLQTGQIDVNGALQQLRQTATAPSGNNNEVDTAFGLAGDKIRAMLVSGLGTVTSGGRIGQYNTQANFIPTATTTYGSVTGGAGTSTNVKNTGMPSYTVKQGDTLSTIASQNGMNLQQLLAINPQFQSNPNLIRPGQQITLGQGQTTPEQRQTQFEDVFGVTNDSKNAQLLALFPQLQTVLAGLSQALTKQIESGKVVNPSIQLKPSDTSKLLDQAHTELDPYFQEQAGFQKADLTNSINKLQQDYETYAQRQKQNYPLAQQKQAESEAQSGTAFSSGRADRQQQLADQENNLLSDAFTNTQRNIQTLGTAAERSLGSSQLGDLSPYANQYQATPQGINTTGQSRLLQLQGGVAGSLPSAQDVAVKNRQSQLEANFRLSRNLDLRSLYQ